MNPFSSTARFIQRLVHFVTYAAVVTIIALVVVLSIPGGAREVGRLAEKAGALLNLSGDPEITVPEITLPEITLPETPTTGVDPTVSTPTPGSPLPPPTVDASGLCRSSWLPTATAADIADAKALLATIPVAKTNSSGYDREKFPHWIDVDSDGFDGRQQALGQQSQVDPPVNNSYDIVSGQWCSPYDGKIYTVPGDLDVDHFVPLSEAWKSGASTWSKEQREQFANDNTHTFSDGGLQLLPVIASENRSKGDKDPSQWMPSNEGARCAYLVNWVRVKATWALTVDESEAGYINKNLDVCAAGGIPKRPGS